MTGFAFLYHSLFRKLRCYLDLPLGGRVSDHALELRKSSGKRSFVLFFTMYLCTDLLIGPPGGTSILL